MSDDAPNSMTMAPELISAQVRIHELERKVVLLQSVAAIAIDELPQENNSKQYLQAYLERVCQIHETKSVL